MTIPYNTRGITAAPPPSQPLGTELKGRVQLFRKSSLRSSFYYDRAPGGKALRPPPNPQIATTLSGIKPAVVQVKPTLTLYPSGAAKEALINLQKLLKAIKEHQTKGFRH